MAAMEVGFCVFAYELYGFGEFIDMVCQLKSDTGRPWDFACLSSSCNITKHSVRATPIIYRNRRYLYSQLQPSVNTLHLFLSCLLLL